MVFTSHIWASDMWMKTFMTSETPAETRLHNLENDLELNQILGSYDEEEEMGAGEFRVWETIEWPCPGFSTKVIPSSMVKQACECGNLLMDGFEYMFFGDIPSGDPNKCG